MPVLAEALSVIIKKDSIERLYKGGWNQFLMNCNHQTLCYDDDIARVGFMSPDDVGSFVKQMQAEGLSYLHNGEALDLTVTDQQTGSLEIANWLEFTKVDLSVNGNKQTLPVCQKKDSINKEIVTPKLWVYEGSLSQTFSFVPTEHIDKSLVFLRHENGCDVYYNKLTGKESYIGRNDST